MLRQRKLAPCGHGKWVAFEADRPFSSFLEPFYGFHRLSPAASVLTFHYTPVKPKDFPYGFFSYHSLYGSRLTEDLRFDSARLRFQDSIETQEPPELSTRLFRERPRLTSATPFSGELDLTQEPPYELLFFALLFQGGTYMGADSVFRTPTRTKTHSFDFFSYNSASLFRGGTALSLLTSADLRFRTPIGNQDTLLMTSFSTTSLFRALVREATVTGALAGGNRLTDESDEDTTQCYRTLRPICRHQRTLSYILFLPHSPFQGHGRARLTELALEASCRRALVQDSLIEDPITDPPYDFFSYTPFSGRLADPTL
nr:hypothetical protein Iba_chr13dCG7240 [Ipomoea batatas]